jgi:hypothetical protein
MKMCSFIAAGGNQATAGYESDFGVSGIELRLFAGGKQELYSFA